MKPALLAAATLLALAAPAATAPAAPQAQRLADYVESAPLLGVDARGGALVTWTAFARFDIPGRVDAQTAVFASVRRPGRGFAPARRISALMSPVKNWTQAVGAGGDSAIVWQPAGLGAPLLVSRDLAAPQRLARSQGASEIAAAIDGRGRAIVAWTRPATGARCGNVVMASVAPRGARFGPARRISAPCAHALILAVALTRGGDGAVAWRASGERAATSRSSIVVSPFADGRFHAPRAVSPVAGVGLTLDLAAGSRRVLVAWRDHGPDVDSKLHRVLAATVAGARVDAPVVVTATRDALLRDVHAAMSARDGAIVAWQQADPGSSVWGADNARGVVALRQAADGPFAAPEVVVGNLLLEASYGLTAVTLARDGRAFAGIGDTLLRRGSGAAWNVLALRGRSDITDGAADETRIGVSDRGEVVAAWLFTTGIGEDHHVRAAVYSSPAKSSGDT